MTYASKVKALLSPAERRLFDKLDTPAKIQDYLDTLPINFELHGETYFSPRETIRAKAAHCLEGALLGAAILAYHGKEPLLMDLRTTKQDEDHVVALFKRNGRWGALSKTNHPILRYRDAVYLSPRELAMSYFHEYYLIDGRKSLRAWGKPFSLAQFAPESWITASKKLQWLVNRLDGAAHFSIASKKNITELRRSSPIERRAVELTEWDRRGKRKKRKK